MRYILGLLILFISLAKAQTPVNANIQLAGGDNAWHTSHATAVPLVRQIVLNTTTGKYKIGDGTTQLQNLTYYSGDLSLYQPLLNGTGFVKANGTTISYDNSTYLTTEVDGSITNELQTLSRTDQTVTLSPSGGSITVQPPLNGTGFVKATGTVITYDNSTYLTTGNAASTYVPYTGATGSVNLGANSFSVGAQSTLNTLYVPNTATVNGAFLANSTATVTGNLMASANASVFGNLSTTGTGSIGSTFTVGGNIQALGSNTFGTISNSNTHTFFTGSASTASMTMQGQVGLTGNFAIYGPVSPSPGNYALVLGATQTYLNGTTSSELDVSGSTIVKANSGGAAVTGTLTASGLTRLGGGITTAGNPTLNVIGTMSVSSTATLNTLVSGSQSITTTGNLGISLNAGTINNRFRMFVSDGTGGFVNEEIYFRILNSRFHFIGGGSGVTELMQIGNDVANSATVSVLGTFSTSSTYSAGGRVNLKQGADVASVAGAIALGSDGNVFEITGTNAITLITSTGWQNGSEITLLFTSTASLTDGTANSGSDIGMELAGNVNFTGSADDSITLVLCEIGGTVRWREKCRSVN